MSQSQINVSSQLGGSVAVRRADFSATASQTTFTISPDSWAGSPMMEVFVGGLRMTLTNDYTLSGSNTVVLNTGAAAGANVSIVWYQPTFSVGTNATAINGFTASSTPGPNILVATDSNSQIPSSMQSYAALIAMLAGAY